MCDFARRLGCQNWECFPSQISNWAQKRVRKTKGEGYHSKFNNLLGASSLLEEFYSKFGWARTGVGAYPQFKNIKSSQHGRVNCKNWQDSSNLLFYAVLPFHLCTADAHIHIFPGGRRVLQWLPTLSTLSVCSYLPCTYDDDAPLGHKSSWWKSVHEACAQCHYLNKANWTGNRVFYSLIDRHGKLNRNKVSTMQKCGNDSRNICQRLWKNPPHSHRTTHGKVKCTRVLSPHLAWNPRRNVIPNQFMLARAAA